MTERKLRPGDGHEAHEHHLLIPAGMPGDFTPVRIDEHYGAEHKVDGPLTEFLHALAAAAAVPAREAPDREAGG